MGQKFREIFEGIKGRLAVSDLVKENQVFLDVYIRIEIRLQGLKYRRGIQASFEGFRQFRIDTEIKMPDPAEMFWTEQVFDRVGFPDLPRTIK